MNSQTFEQAFDRIRRDIPPSCEIKVSFFRTADGTILESVSGCNFNHQRISLDRDRGVTPEAINDILDGISAETDQDASSEMAR